MAVESGRTWPKWPTSNEETERHLVAAARSHRWSPTGKYNGVPSFDDRFCQAFSRYLDIEHCLTVSSGSSALLVALAALGIGPGDEVLVPGLTWVAVATSVVRVGATPVLVDIDPVTLCLDPGAAESAITARTRCLILVHALGNLADLPALSNLAQRHGLAVIEDASQAHGAMINGRRVGTFGDVGVFSMQDSKVLSCGDGGAIVTADADLFDRMLRIRTDGRLPSTQQREGFVPLSRVGETFAWNDCLSEFGAAVLLGQLPPLEAQILIRERNAVLLGDLLADVPGVTVPSPPSHVRRSIYRLPLALDPELLGAASVEEFAEQQTALLGFPVDPLEEPLDRHPLFRPDLSAWGRGADSGAGFRIAPSGLPHCDRARRTHICIPHNILLGTSDDMRVVAEAIRKGLS